MSMQAIKYILFDLDGTLVDSPIDFNGMRKSLGITKRQDILIYLDSIKEKDPAGYSRGADIVYQFELEASKKARIYEGVFEFLEFLKNGNFKMGVVTRNCREVAQVQMTGIEHFFEEILTRDDVQNPKPHPESFKFFNEKYKFIPDNTLFIGNHRHDYEFARNNKLMYLEYVPEMIQKKNHQSRQFEFASYVSLRRDFMSQMPEVF